MKRKRWRRRGGCIGRVRGCWSREIWWKWDFRCWKRKRQIARCISYFIMKEKEGFYGYLS